MDDREKAIQCWCRHGHLKMKISLAMSSSFGIQRTDEKG
jgi:hypothetical protein